jgi:putative ABC transport system permease protein
MNYVPLSPLDLALAATMLVINGGLSVAFQLGLERTLAVAAARMVAQLLLAGLVLKFVFQQTSPAWTAAIAALMIGAAGYEALARQERKISGWQSLGLSTGTLFLVGTLSVLFAVGAVIRPSPWYMPHYVLPLLGMVLGNSLTGIALTLDAVTSNAAAQRGAIEARLSLGASRFAAMDGVLRRALKTGLMPILNSMAATGVVSLPGMMTGQILAGLPPLEAAKYQIMIMFLLAGATAFGVVIAGVGSVLLLTDDRHRLRLDRLQAIG